MNNGFNSQNPNEYEYYSQNAYQKPKKQGMGILIATIAVIMAIVSIISASVVIGVNQVNDGGYTDNGSDNNTDNDKDFSSDKNSDTNVNKENSVPEFTPSGDSNADLSTAFTEIYENCSPSCCTIRVYVRGQVYSIGSGFVIDAENGYIATNHHVIEDGDEVKTIFYNGEEYTAEVVGSDPTTDLAVLRIDAENLVQVEIGNSDNVKVGETVVAIGTPYDEALAGTMTSGIVSGLARGIDITNDSGKVIKTMTLIQTDCSINPGNSGGPLFDMSGNVVGITSLKIADEMYEGIGFAIPITDAVDIFKKLIAGEPITDSGIATAKPRIGVTVYDLEYGLEYFRISPKCDYPTGLLVGSVESDSAAYEAGLSYYDIITEFGDKTIETLDDLDAELSKYKAGDEITMKVFRFNRRFTSGEYVEISFKLDAAE